jgi:hypothetical protein
LITNLDDRLLIKISMKGAAGCRADRSVFGLDPLLALPNEPILVLLTVVEGAVHRP